MPWPCVGGIVPSNIYLSSLQLSLSLKFIRKNCSLVSMSAYLEISSDHSDHKVASRSFWLLVVRESFSPQRCGGILFWWRSIGYILGSPCVNVFNRTALLISGSALLDVRQESIKSTRAAGKEDKWPMLILFNIMRQV